MEMTAEMPTAESPTKPRLRGWLHAGALPAALIAGFALVALGPTPQARLAAAIYAITSGLLFGVSATYHRGTLSPRLTDLLRRLDHANIYLIIAGTHTPFALLALDGSARVAVLAVVWTGALGGVVFRVLWLGAPRLLYTAGVAAVLLVVAGGVLYSAGGVVYGLRRPDPSPRWFGYHEVFHAFTLGAYALQYIAVSLVVYSAA
jgi:hemolysin III